MPVLKTKKKNSKNSGNYFLDVVVWFQHHHAQLSKHFFDASNSLSSFATEHCCSSSYDNNGITVRVTSFTNIVLSYSYSQAHHNLKGEPSQRLWCRIYSERGWVFWLQRRKHRQRKRLRPRKKPRPRKKLPRKNGSFFRWVTITPDGDVSHPAFSFRMTFPQMIQERPWIFSICLLSTHFLFTPFSPSFLSL